MNIVALGQQNWDVTWVTKQHLLSRLARRGHRVLYVDPVPGDEERVREVDDGLHVLTPRRRGALPGRIEAKLQFYRLRRAAERLGQWAPVCVCFWPVSRWLIPAVRPVATVYFAEDDNAGFGGLDPDSAEASRREERLLLEQCDLALAVSPTLLERFKPVQPRSFLQENGVALDDFGPEARRHATVPDFLKGLIGPQAGFVGQIDERLDQELVVKVAERMRRRGGGVVLAGRVKEGVNVSSLAAEPNVTFAGFIEYRCLAGVYKGLAVGLVPYVRSPLTEACNPLKVYEYLAADLPTVATDLPGLNSCRPAVRVAADHQSFLEGLDDSLDRPRELGNRRAEVAAGASWQRRADEFEDRLREAEAIGRRRDVGDPAPDRRGRVVVTVPPRLDGKDGSVRFVSDDYRGEGLSSQQEMIYAGSRVLGNLYYVARRLARLARGDRRQIARILVVRNGHLGDTVVFFPTLAALRSGFPAAHIVVAVAPGGGGAALMRASPYVDEVLELDFFNRDRRRRLIGAWNLLRRGFDVVVGGVWYFHLPEAVFAGAPLRLGLYDGHPLQRYADRAVPLDPTLHEAENNLRLVELICGRVPPQDRAPQMHLDEENVLEAGRRFRKKVGLTHVAPAVAMHPGSKRPSRRWPPERFAELATLILAERPKLHVVLTGAGGDERGLIERIRSLVDPSVRDRVLSGHGAGDLMGLVGFLDSCRCLVCNDTGVMHVARARGVPVVAVVGPENDRRWGPHPLGTAPAIAVRQQVPGTPHNRDVCDWNLSLASISADRVAGHVERVLGGQAHGGATTIGGRQFFRCERDVERLSFEQLAGRGLRVPGVAVVVPRSASLLGLREEPGDAPDAPDDLRAAVRAAAGQAYPALDVIAVTDRPGELEPVAGVRVVAVGPDDADAAWAAVLESTDAGLFLPAAATTRLPASAVAARVGVYLRGPSVDVAGRRQMVPPPLVGHAWRERALCGELLFTRDALLDLLQHPLPSRPARRDAA